LTAGNPARIAAFETPAEPTSYMHIHNPDVYRDPA
jgi:hypothetical protein